MSLNFPPGVENLTYTSDNGTLYVYQKGAWRVVSPAGEGGAQVIVSETAPDVTGLEEGTLWWDSNQGDLFVLYANENQDGTIDMIWADATNHSNADDRDVIISDQEPTNPDFIGQLWVNTSECPPTLNVWNGDCDGNGGEWVPIEGGGSSGLIQLGVAIISSGKPDNYVGSTLTATGGEGLGSEGAITPVYSWTRDGVTIPSNRGAEVTADVEGVYQVTATVQDPNTAEVSTQNASIVINPFGEITFTPVITDDGTSNGNKVGHVLTASATNIQDGSGNADEYAFQWKSAGSNVGTAKTYTLEASDVGQEITCDITVAESDGSGAVTETATYSKDVEFLGTIVKPTILSPEDGAGSGAQRYLISDTIIEVEGGGISTCETSLIESVDRTPPTTYDCRVLNGTFGDTPDSWDSLPASPRYDGVAIGTKPTADTGIYTGLVYKIDVPGFIRINPNAGGADASIPVKLWSSNDGINWVGPTEVTQGNIDPSHASYDASIGFYGQYGCIQRQGGTNIAAWYPTGSEALTTLTFPDTQGFDCFEPGDVVQDPDVKVISKTEEDPWQIVVDGGNWATGTDFVADYSDNIDSNQFYNGRPERIYNGLTGSALPESHCSFYANTETTVFNGPSVTVNTTLRVHANSDASAVYKINGAPVTVAGNNYNWGWRDVTFTGVMNTLTITDTYQSSIASIEVDGKQLYDSGEVPNKLVKETSYDTKLTVAGDKDLAEMTGATFMSDGSGAPGPYTQTPYKLVTSDIESVNDTDPANITLTFPGDVSTNPDLQYFKAGDVVNQYVPGGGDIYMVTDAGVPFFDDPGFLTFDSTADDIFSDTENPGNSYIVRANSWLEVQFLGGVQVQNTLYIYVGDYNGFPYEVYINDEKIDGPEENGKWPNQEFAATSNAIPFSGILKKFKIVCDTGPVLRQFFVDQDVLANKITGTVAYQKLQEVKVISTGYPDSNTMTVDGGEWSDGSDRELGDWDALMTVSAGVVDNKIHAWNGIYVEDAKGGIEYNGALGTSTGSVMTVEFPVDGRLPAGPLEVLCFPKNYLYSAAAVFVTVNDGAPITINAIDDGFVEIAADASTVSKFEVITDGASNPVLQAVRVDGKIMVDNQFINTGGATHVEYQTNGGKGDIVSTNTDDNTILLSDTGDRDNRWIAENKAGTDFYVAGGAIVDEPLLTADVLLESTPLTTEPVDGLVIDKKYVWTLNGAVQETDQNPYRPTLSLNTEYTVSCVHKDGQGNLEDSEESNSITFTTGASRNVFEYQQNIITELRSRLSSIEADEINDDATDTLLISTIADLINRVNALEGN